MPKRIELVKRVKQSVDRELSKNLTRDRWSKCFLSNEELEPPIVGCALGRLYNKEAILRYLLDRKRSLSFDSRCQHLTSVSDVRELSLTKTSQRKDGKLSRFMCPVTFEEMNGLNSGVKFVFLWTCGCVFSNTALKKMPEAKTCFVCSKPFAKKSSLQGKANLEAVANETEDRARLLESLGDVVVIYPSDDSDIKDAQVRAELLASRKRDKVSKKRKHASSSSLLTCSRFKVDSHPT